MQIIPKVERTLTKIFRGGPSHRNTQGIILVKWVKFPIVTTNKEITSFPRPVGRRKIEDHQRRPKTPRKIKETLGGLLQAEKVEEQSYTGDTKSPVPEEANRPTKIPQSLGASWEGQTLKCCNTPFMKGCSGKRSPLSKATSKKHTIPGTKTT